MSSLYYNKGDLILAMYMYTSAGSKDNFKVLQEGPYIVIRKTKTCVYNYTKQ